MDHVDVFVSQSSRLYTCGTLQKLHTLTIGGPVFDLLNFTTTIILKAPSLTALNIKHDTFEGTEAITMYFKFRTLSIETQSNYAIMTESALDYFQEMAICSKNSCAMTTATNSRMVDHDDVMKKHLKTNTSSLKHPSFIFCAFISDAVLMALAEIRLLEIYY
ncbi:hypothetical protein BDA99DRAFT_577645 [Phascolomyces articulosus]|uniref:Uncharacterized protein n=1 Tax=Phascolomyces articulosus TaxID=60185 RepID=A0AAD5PLX6_9FUNG|nr:hypothetical protein BDA99DRAFT_577645 [Phascolomyces articulosus]